MATIQERASPGGKKSYRVRIRLRGYPIQTATFDRKTDAKKWIQDTESAIREGRHFKTREAKKHTFGDLIDRYVENVLQPRKRSRQERFTHLAWWKERLGDYLLADVTPALIAETRDSLARGVTYRGTQRSPATVVRYLASVSHAFTIAVKEWGWVDDNPLRKVTKPKEPRGRVRFLNEKEQARLLEACKNSPNPYLYTIVILALSTGMRQGEILNLTWADVDTDK
ncbi:MAG: integrase, partial [Chlamydiales bacterium]